MTEVSCFLYNALLKCLPLNPFFFSVIKAKSALLCERESCQCLLSSEGSTHLWSSRGPSSWDRSCRFRCLPGKLHVQSTGPCRRPWGSHILARPTPQSSGTLPGHIPLGLSMLGPGSPLKRGFQRDSVRHASHLLFASFGGKLVSLFEAEENDNCREHAENNVKIRDTWAYGTNLQVLPTHLLTSSHHLP